MREQKKKSLKTSCRYARRERTTNGLTTFKTVHLWDQGTSVRLVLIPKVWYANSPPPRPDVGRQ